MFLSANSPWVIFDGDNTLWHVEQLYDESRRELCDQLARMGADAGAVDSYQRVRDHALHATYGYSACRFARSFEDTLLHFVPGCTALEIRHVRALALDVFERPALIDYELPTVIGSFDGKFHLGIITAGERWVQQRRLEQFHLLERFSAIEIVEEKNAVVFARFCEQHNVRIADSWMVGDSPKSDVLPALSIGMKAVLLEAHNWRPVEHTPLPATVPRIGSLKELPAVMFGAGLA